MNLLNTALMLVAFAGAVVAFETRYVHAEAFEAHVAFSEAQSLEDQLWRLQEKLAQLLAVPEEQRAQWQRQEIIRLENSIENVKRKLARYG